MDEGLLCPKLLARQMEREREEMRLPQRKPITYMTSEQLEGALKPHFGSKENGSYFIGFGVGPGWSDIILDLHMKLVKEHPDYVIHQVKEKFAGLRYYVGGMTDKGHEYIMEAEGLSEITCEECGRPGKLRQHNYWIRTLCDVDSAVDRINKHLWTIQKRGLKVFFKGYFAMRRINKKRKRSAENGDF